MQVPKYQIVIDWISEEIESGRLRLGDSLPTEYELCRQFNMSRQTIRRATQELVEKKIVTRVQGSGTYVGSVRASRNEKRYMTVAVISTYCDEYIFPSVLRGIEKGLTQKGYSMQLSFTGNKTGGETRILKRILNNPDVDGIIVEPSRSVLENPNIEYYRRIIEKRIPVLFFNDAYASLNAPCIRIDDYKVGADATKLLMWAGHTSIGGIFKLDDGQGPRRYAGYRDVMNRELDFLSKHVVWIDTYDQKHLKELESYVFQRLNGCTAVLCYNDEVAVQLIDMATQRGLRVPEDLSVVSIDDSSLAGSCQVPITSYAHPKELLGEKVAENLIRKIENPMFDANYIFQSEPVYRNSIKYLD